MGQWVNFYQYLLPMAAVPVDDWLLILIQIEIQILYPLT